MSSVRSYLVAAYAVFWLLPFALILSIWLRQRRVERELDDVARRLHDETQ
ncbi:MAG: hypothetical protein GX620_04615 [Chloroflexi bacterium]|nr:hypothetical protein [Chloroflexota bacterium]